MKRKKKISSLKKKVFILKIMLSQNLLITIKTKLVKVSLNRVAFLFFIFFSLMLIFSIKIIYLSLSSEKNFFSENIKKNFIKERRDIVDRNGSIIARNVNLYDVGIRPKLLK